MREINKSKLYASKVHFRQKKKNVQYQSNENCLNWELQYTHTPYHSIKSITPKLTNNIQWHLWIANTYGSSKICPLLRGVHYWEVVQQRSSRLRLMYSAIQGMSTIWDARYWEVSLYNNRIPQYDPLTVAELLIAIFYTNNRYDVRNIYLKCRQTGNKCRKNFRVIECVNK